MGKHYYIGADKSFVATIKYLVFSRHSDMLFYRVGGAL